MEHNTERQQLSSEPVIPTADQLSRLYVEWSCILKGSQLHMNLLEPFILFRRVLLQVLSCTDCTVQHLLESASTPRKGEKLSQAAAALHEFKSLSAGKGITQNNLYLIVRATGTFAMLLVLLLGGFIVAKDDIVSWMKWGYYISPLMYGQNVIAVNEFLDERWNDVASYYTRQPVMPFQNGWNNLSLLQNKPSCPRPANGHTSSIIQHQASGIPKHRSSKTHKLARPGQNKSGSHFISVEPYAVFNSRCCFPAQHGSTKEALYMNSFLELVLTVEKLQEL
ncbi:hypothetical protein POM88_032579 [Heracleum sosnowskyi]|uniref:ABC-2 type transporter transmembrane domain-containing protein n=1 Tax=Heracleum sosnowskyi TaxID=360622 RepID=A0AAD8HZW7_9APIA|nr:hypothetical protein POM88_032579 [Heracleum sosnowskyi]